jgi:hypothetical protein
VVVNDRFQRLAKSHPDVHSGSSITIRIHPRPCGAGPVQPLTPPMVMPRRK